MAQKIKVAILGGGIGGLTAAHELAERGGDFDVHVYEAGPYPGGKALSQFLPDTGKDGRHDLPGEHGFRFFPAWYKHVPDTMARIPRPVGGTVADDLVGCTEMGLAEGTLHALARHRPGSIGQFFKIVDAIAEFFAGTKVTVTDMGRFGLKMLDYLITCEARRREYDRMSFFDYVDGTRYTPTFQSYLNSSRFMVAMDVREGSAYTIGNKALQILIDFKRPEGQNDRVLSGPTTTQWIDPWIQHLRRMGVTFHLGKPVIGLDVDAAARRVTGARIAGEPEAIAADHYIAALPIERVMKLLTDEVAGLDDALVALREAAQRMRLTSWMVGAQYFLDEDVPLCDGHVAYPQSSWALSSISQASFWNRGKPPSEWFHARYGDGSVKGVLSVDISAWDRKSPRLGKTARECTTPDEVLDEVWAQIEESLNDGGASPLRRSNVRSRHLDTAVRFYASGAENPTPLLVHPPGSWSKRPEPVLKGIENLSLAADYVRTETDLATMEGASEAARRAVNGILARAGKPATARVFPVTEDTGALVAMARQRDERAYRENKPLVEWTKRRGPGDREIETLNDARDYQDRIAHTLAMLSDD